MAQHIVLCALNATQGSTQTKPLGQETQQLQLPAHYTAGALAGAACVHGSLAASRCKSHTQGSTVPGVAMVGAWEMMSKAERLCLPRQGLLWASINTMLAHTAPPPVRYAPNTHHNTDVRRLQSPMCSEPRATQPQHSAALSSLHVAAAMTNQWVGHDARLHSSILRLGAWPRLQHRPAHTNTPAAHATAASAQANAGTAAALSPAALWLAAALLLAARGARSVVDAGRLPISNFWPAVLSMYCEASAGSLARGLGARVSL